jgi:hypothetical protein
LSHDHSRSATYREACKERGLLRDDAEWSACLEEAVALCTIGEQLLDLFTVILGFCEPSNPRALFDTFQHELGQHLLYRKRRDCNNHTLQFQAIYHELLSQISDRLHEYGISNQQLGLPEPLLEETNLPREILLALHSYNREDLAQQALQAECTMTVAQRQIYEQLKADVEYVYAFSEHTDPHHPHVHMIDAPGGSGKTFVEQCLIAHCRAQGMHDRPTNGFFGYRRHVALRWSYCAYAV